MGKSVNGVNANFNIARAGVVGVGGEGYAGVNGVEGVPEAGVQGQRGGYGEETEEAGGMGREGEEQQAAGQQGEGAEEAGGRGRGGEGAEAEAEDVAEERRKVELSWRILEASEGGTPGAEGQAPVPAAVDGGVAGPWAEGMAAGEAAGEAAGAVAGAAGEAAAGAAGPAAVATAGAASSEAVPPAVLLMGLRKVYPSKVWTGVDEHMARGQGEVRQQDSNGKGWLRGQGSCPKCNSARCNCKSTKTGGVTLVNEMMSLSCEMGRGAAVVRPKTRI